MLNGLGQVASVKDAAGKTMTYAYDAFGNLAAVTDSAGNTALSAVYDLRGRKTSATNADSGTWTYGYDGLGELVTQVDPRERFAGVATTLGYDALGRVLSREEPDLAATQPGLESRWNYDTSPNGVGMLHATCTLHPCTDADSRTLLTYDAAGRVLTQNKRLDGTVYGYTASYDGNGRLATLAYPSGFTAKYVYTQRGYLKQIQDAGDGTVLWQADSEDAELHVTQWKLGNGAIGDAGYDAQTGRVLNIAASNDQTDPGDGTLIDNDGTVANQSYSWDAVGNLSERTDMMQGMTPLDEQFCYDALDRLTDASQGASCTSATRHLHVAYDALGNITQKSDVCATANCFAYSAGNPHELSGITGSYDGVTNPTFQYDGDGNLKCVLGAGESCNASAARLTTWTSYNMVNTIAQGTNSLQFDYGPDHERFKSCVPDCTNPTTTTYYTGDVITGAGSVKQTSGSTVIWRDTIVAPGVGIVAVRFDTMGIVTWSYGVNDVIGSPMAVLDGGPQPQHEAFDAWGKQRFPGGGADPTCSLTSLLPRGYTGQEAMDAFCMVNMNARIYDPTLGRFMSADSIVPDASDMQSYNAYAYGLGNPLAYIDPTGHQEVPPAGGGTGGTSGGGSSSGGNVFQDFRNLCLYMDGCESYGGSLPATLFGGGGGVGSSGIGNSIDGLLFSGTDSVTVEEIIDGQLVTTTDTGTFSFFIPFNSSSVFSPDIVANIPEINFINNPQQPGKPKPKPFCALIAMRDTGHFLGYLGTGGAAVTLTITALADTGEASTGVGAPATLPTTLGGLGTSAGLGLLALAGTGMEYTAKGAIALQTGSYNDLFRSGATDAIADVTTSTMNALSEGKLAPIKDLMSLATSDALSKNDDSDCK